MKELTPGAIIAVFECSRCYEQEEVTLDTDVDLASDDIQQTFRKELGACGWHLDEVVAEGYVFCPLCRECFLEVTYGNGGDE